MLSRGAFNAFGKASLASATRVQQHLELLQEGVHAEAELVDEPNGGSLVVLKGKALHLVIELAVIVLPVLLAAQVVHLVVLAVVVLRAMKPNPFSSVHINSIHASRRGREKQSVSRTRGGL